MNERIRKLRKTLDLTQQEFANKLGMKQNTIATYEMGRANPSDQTIRSICREFNVNDSWLRTGEGEMFIQIPEKDETADLVYDLLGPARNEFHDIIIEIMRTYKELSPSAQQTLTDFAAKLRENMQKKNED